MPAVELHRDCPGYAEAARREDEIRAVPFLGIEERIAGLPAQPLTLRKVQWLTMTKSPFLLRVTSDDLIYKPDLCNDIVTFLWIISPKFMPGNKRNKKQFNKKYLPLVLSLEAPLVVREILEYVDESFLDAGEAGQDQRSYYCTAASLVGFFHRNYGLQIDVWENHWARRIIRKLTGQPNIMDIPLKIAFQLIRSHQQSESPGASFHNRLSQPKVDAWLTELNLSN